MFEVIADVSLCCTLYYTNSHLLLSHHSIKQFCYLNKTPILMHVVVDMIVDTSG